MREFNASSVVSAILSNVLLSGADASDCAGGHPASFCCRGGDDFLGLRPAESLGRSDPSTSRNRYSDATTANRAQSRQSVAETLKFRCQTATFLPELIEQR